MEVSLARAASLVAVTAVLLVAGAALWWWAARALRGARARARMRRAQRGERAGRALLIARGFEVTSEQAPGQVVLHVDGEEAAFAVRADYLVSRGGRTFVAEVKTGTRAPSLEHGPTRRQLLEYASAFAVDGVLLVDPEAGSVREVSFGARGPRGDFRPFASGVALGLVLGVAIAAIGTITSP